MEDKKKKGGLYANVKMSVKTADMIVLAGIAALGTCLFYSIFSV